MLGLQFVGKFHWLFNLQFGTSYKYWNDEYKSILDKQDVMALGNVVGANSCDFHDPWHVPQWSLKKKQFNKIYFHKQNKSIYKLLMFNDSFKLLQIVVLRPGFL